MKQEGSKSKQWLAWWLVGWVLWVVFTFNDALTGTAVLWYLQWLLAMGCAALWAWVTPLIRRVSRRFPLRARPSFPLVFGHVIASMLVSLLLTTAMTWWFILLQRAISGSWLPFHQVFPGTAYYFILVMMVFYWAVIAADSAWLYFAQLQEKRALTERLEKQLAEAKLKVLQAQLQPHFLFNTLHSLGALIRVGEPNLAQEVLVNLGDLLRMALSSHGQSFVSLQQELTFVEKYFAIERVRFGSRAVFRVNAPKELLSARVPQFSIQPLAENAVRHGLEKDPDAHRVEVELERKGDLLGVHVRDDGPGFAAGWDLAEDARTGLGHTVARLRGLYADKFSFQIQQLPEGGACVSLWIPLHFQEGTSP